MFSPKYDAGFISVLQLIKKVFNVECKKRSKCEVSLTSSPISVPNIESQRWDVSFKLSTLNSAIDPGIARSEGRGQGQRNKLCLAGALSLLILPIKGFGLFFFKCTLE